VSAVRFEHVSKRFYLHHERARTFQEAALGMLRLRQHPARSEEFWALRDVSFSLERGRTLGVIGRNGSGKSTLLKLLAGTMRPTAGSIQASGRIFGLLELAAGFHPDLSGRENVFLNGSFLGLSRAEMAARLDGIVAFAELEQFIDTPVKHYSSGMYMRLGFSIAISIDPDILVIDEVLAVGDASFRQKCFVALADLKAHGKTILFVTHDASAVRRFCDEALWLDHGIVRAAGTAEAVLKEYLAETTSTHGEALVFSARQDDPLMEARGFVSLTDVVTVDERGRPERHFEPGQVVGVRLRYRAAQRASEVALAVGLHRADGLYVWGSHSPPADVQAGEHEVVCTLGALPLAAAEYSVSGAVLAGGEPVHRLRGAALLAIRPPRRNEAGLLVLDAVWSRENPKAASDSDVLGGDAGHSLGPVVFRPGTPEDQMSAEEAFRMRWLRAPSRVTMGQGEDEFLGHGWYAPEDWPPVVRWTGQHATVHLAQDEWTSSVGVSMGRPQHGAQILTGRVLVGGSLAGTFELASPGIEPFTFPVEPAENGREVEVRIEIDNPLRPEPGDGDQRVLGVAVRDVWLE